MNQIFELIKDENSQVKGVIITQLSPKNRKLVFMMYTPEERVGLMKELCHGDSLPKEYLINVAKALHKKVLTQPKFDTANLRSNEVVLELIEKASIDEQQPYENCPRVIQTRKEYQDASCKYRYASLPERWSAA